MSILVGIHPVREALKSGRQLDRVLVAKGAGGQRIQEIVDLCRQAKVSVRFEPKATLDKAAAGASHQGVIAFGSARGYASLEEIGPEDRLVLVLDGVEDPHNLGAILRTANAAGVSAVIIPERRAVHLTETVAKAAAGAVEYVRVVKVPNITRALEDLKKRGFWIYGFDEGGSGEHDRMEYATPTAFVLGSEGKGLHQLVREHCDFLVRIPMAGKIPSLNVSVAAGVVLFEWRRRFRA